MKTVKSVTDNDVYLQTEQVIKKQTDTLTTEKLKSFPGCEEYSDAEATDIVHSLELLANVLYGFHTNLQNVSIDNQQVVYLEQENDLNLIHTISPKSKTVAA